MAYNHQQVPFWDFIRSFDQQGAGVDHTQPPNFFGPPPYPFQGPTHHGPGPCHGGSRGRHCRRDRSEGEGEASKSRTVSPNAEGAEGEKTDGEAREGPRGFGRRGGHGHGPHGRGGRGGWGHHGRRGHPFASMGNMRSMGGPGEMGGFDLSGLFKALNSHPVGQQPWAQMLRQYAEQAGLAGGAARSGEALVPESADAENTFLPPIDVFSTEAAYILHIALPGAKKEDVGVNWDAEKSSLNVAGVVYRQGDEEFLRTLSQSERKVGVFERTVKLPPGDEEKEEVDGDAISAKLEDGVLVVTVPKVEKEENWTEVKRIDIL